MGSADLYDLGYAVPLYGIDAEKRTWRWRDEEYTIPMDAVMTLWLTGVRFPVALIEDVRRAHG